ncbi:MAG: YqaJ viral recombinase family protein [Alistipes senegalensis]|nr:YqaJ viral recombinase family protein [Oxalobacter formigenes]MCM1280939.1 YqaJ viral recombinase family protein [Alistipes senegalensis]
MTHSDFLAARQTGIGGSDIGAILGVSPFKTAMDVYLAKVEPNPEDEQTELTYWGHALEPAIIERFARDHGIVVDRPEKIARHPQHGWMVANLDGIILDSKPGVLEIKNVNQFAAKHWGEAGSDNVPLAYVAQCAWYMAVMDFDYAVVAALFGGHDYREFRIERDEDLEKLLISRGHDFWHTFVLPKTPPAPVTERDTLRLLGKSQDEGTAVADEDTFSLYRELANAKADAAVLGERIKSLEAKLKIVTGTASALAYHDKTLATWKVQKCRRLDQQALKAACPDIYERFLKTSETRVFRLK